MKKCSRKYSQSKANARRAFLNETRHPRPLPPCTPRLKLFRRILKRFNQIRRSLEVIFSPPV